MQENRLQRIAFACVAALLVVLLLPFLFLTISGGLSSGVSSQTCLDKKENFKIQCVQLAHRRSLNLVSPLLA